MGDMGNYFKEWNEHYREVRKNCKEKRLEFLRSSELDYEVKSEGASHIRIFTPKAKYDVWLGTGKWTKTGTNKFRQDWNGLLKQIDLDYKAD